MEGGQKEEEEASKKKKEKKKVRQNEKKNKLENEKRPFRIKRTIGSSFCDSMIRAMAGDRFSFSLICIASLDWSLYGGSIGIYQ